MPPYYRRAFFLFGVLAVIAIGHRFLLSSDTSTPSTLKLQAPNISYVPQQPIIEYRSECTQRVIEKYEFGSSFAPFPGERCSTRFVYPAGACAVFKANDNGPEQGPYGDCPGSKTPQQPTDPKLAKSIGAPFTVRLTVDQPVPARR